MTRTIEHYLALVTVSMPFILGGAHTLLSIAQAAHGRSKTTTSTADDAVTSRLLVAATWIDLVARSIAHAASLGFFLRNDTPRAERDGGDES